MSTCENRVMVSRRDSRRCSEDAHWVITRDGFDGIRRLECDDHARQTRGKISRSPGLRVAPLDPAQAERE